MATKSLTQRGSDGVRKGPHAIPRLGNSFPWGHHGDEVAYTSRERWAIPDGEFVPMGHTARERWKVYGGRRAKMIALLPNYFFM